MATVDNLIRLGGTQILRNNDLLPLADKQLKTFAPTIFAKSGIEGVSENYGFVSTFEVIKAMRDEGYECVEVRQSRRRDAERMPWTKHMLKFKNTKNKKMAKVGDVIPQIVMLNSHDKSSGFHLYFGMFRLVCTNGLIVSDGDLVEPLKVRHNIKMVEDIIDKSRTLVRGADGIFALRDHMLGLKLTDKEAIKFATDAVQFRPPRRSGILLPATLLEARRTEDKPNDLWHVFNRVQENMMRGGASTQTEGGRNVQTKGIGRIERDVQVNSALWGLAVETLNKRGKAPTKTSAKRKALTQAEVLGEDAE